MLANTHVISRVAATAIAGELRQKNPLGGYGISRIRQVSEFELSILAMMECGVIACEREEQKDLY